MPKLYLNNEDVFIGTKFYKLSGILSNISSTKENWSVVVIKLHTWKKSLRPSDMYASIKLSNIGTDDGLSPVQHQTTVWTNADLLLIGPLETTQSEILVKIEWSSFTNMHLKMSEKCQAFHTGCIALTCAAETSSFGGSVD